jgi:hypothetical protein
MSIAKLCAFFTKKLRTKSQYLDCIIIYGEPVRYCNRYFYNGLAYNCFTYDSNYVDSHSKYEIGLGDNRSLFIDYDRLKQEINYRVDVSDQYSDHGGDATSEFAKLFLTFADEIIESSRCGWMELIPGELTFNHKWLTFIYNDGSMIGISINRSMEGNTVTEYSSLYTATYVDGQLHGSPALVVKTADELIAVNCKGSKVEILHNYINSSRTTKSAVSVK